MSRRHHPFAPCVIVRCRPVARRNPAVWSAAAVALVVCLACLAALLQVWS